MKYLKRFYENISIYNTEWEKMIPDNLVVLKGQDYGIDRLNYKKGNVMLHADMIQITYDIDNDVAPDTLEIDLYFVTDTELEKRGDSTTILKSGVFDYDTNIKTVIPNLRMSVDITFGDQMACEFSIDKKRGLRVFQSTSYGSKFDPTNSLFALDKKSLDNFIIFLNRFNHGVSLDREDFRFLQQN